MASWSRSIPASHPAAAPPTPTTCPSHKTVYAMRDLDRLRRMAAGHGEAIGVYATALLDIPLPWTKMRQVYALLGLVKKWGAERVDAACASALEHEAVNVGLIGRMLERGTEAHRRSSRRCPARVIAGRFARDPAHFAVAARTPAPDTAPLRLEAIVEPVRADRRSGPMSAPTVTPELRRCCAASSSAAASTPSPNASPSPTPAGMGHAEFLELVLADEVTRRETTSADRRARAAGLDPEMTLGPLGRHRQDHLRPRTCGTSCARCASSSPATTP